MRIKSNSTTDKPMKKPMKEYFTISKISNQGDGTFKKQNMKFVRIIEYTEINGKRVLTEAVEFINKTCVGLYQKTSRGNHTESHICPVTYEMTYLKRVKLWHIMDTCRYVNNTLIVCNMFLRS